MRPVFASFALIALCGCELLQTELPSISHKSDALVQSPSERMMAAYYCPKVVPDLLIPGSAAVACSVAFSSPPSQSAMNVGFRSSYTVDNPNQFPIPLTEL